ncbi:hypothetical protein SAMN05216553_109199 [Lentzea fradiae]|uniref:Uncharacterized protein n=1 Tax=Lentzea fradiae TaxID=200378 RepID=A0A1G7VFH0_9PSEU|nr:DUF6223 family protein [Lentzea fradiae]SDG58447.1 hypothetical protein SAMN05216553_109199 [Lentzea fradiae]
MTLAAAYEMTSGRLWSLVGVAFGLGGVLWVVVRRGRSGVVALVCGGVGIVLGAMVVLMAKGGPGTGYGIVGGYFSLVLGVAAAVAGWLAIRRGVRAGARRAG